MVAPSGPAFGVVSPACVPCSPTGVVSADSGPGVEINYMMFFLLITSQIMFGIYHPVGTFK